MYTSNDLFSIQFEGKTKAKSERKITILSSRIYLSGIYDVCTSLSLFEKQQQQKSSFTVGSTVYL